MSRLLVAQRALTVPGWAKNALWRSARAIPSLDLPFADSKSLVDAITGRQLISFARASSGTYTDSAGVLQTAATDVPRFDHNPLTGESLGLLVEEQRTNSIRNNTMVGAVAGTPGTLPTNWTTQLSGLTQTVVGTGTSNGVTYIDIRVNGTTTNTFVNLNLEGTSAIAASNGQSWTGSSWLSIVGGTTTNITFLQLALNQYSNVSVYLSTLSGANRVSTISSTLARVADTYATNNALTAFVQPVLAMTVNNASAVDITFRIGLPQLEQGAFATSVIPTTTAAATRNADVAQITGTNFSSWYRQDEGTVYVEYRDPGVATTNRTPYAISDGTGNNRIQLFLSGTITINNRHVAGGVANNPGTLSAALGSRNRHAIAAAVNSCNAASNGTLATASAPASMPVVNRLNIGINGVADGDFLNAPLARLTYWPQALPGQLQAITQP